MCVCMYMYLGSPRGKFPRGLRYAGACEDFLSSLAPRYYLIRPLTRAHESAELYYKPESYTRIRQNRYIRGLSCFRTLS